MRPFQAHCHRGLGTLYAKLGQPEQAHVKLSAAIVLYRAMDMTLWLSEVEEALVQRITLATEHRFACYLATEMAQEGWIFVAQGRVEEGLATMRRGLAELRNTGAGGLVAEHLAWLVEAHGHVGQIDKDLSTLDEALDLVHQTEERWWEAALYRLQGELLRKASSGVQSAEWTLQAVFSTRSILPGPAGEVVRATNRDEPRPPVAGTGQAR